MKTGLKDADLRWDIEEFKRTASEREAIRRRLLKYISLNQQYLTTTRYLVKARRGYLKDLTDWDVLAAAQEIVTNKS